MRESRFWTWHLIAGALIFVLLGLHMLVMHFDALVGFMNPAGHEATAWENVVHRARILFFTVSYIVLLGAALYHGLYGTRILLFELNLPPAWRRVVSGALVVVGLALFALGAVANIIVHTTHAGG